jgi:hypothetical protein
MAVRTNFVAGEVLTAEDLDDTFASKLDLAGGKILQIVRATDSTTRTTTSTSYVDANISVTITPQKSDSAILLMWSVDALPDVSNNSMFLQITDNSNNPISGAEEQKFGDSGSGRIRAAQTLIGYATPATTSATTYKGRFKSDGSSSQIVNGAKTGQLYAIEVSA